MVPPDLYRNAIPNGEAALDSAVWLIDHMCGLIGTPDLGQLDVLDFGCGVRFTQVFVNRGVPIGRYVGVDVSREVVDFLRAKVSDPRFEYFHLDAHNERYNPTGRPLAELSVPEIEPCAVGAVPAGGVGLEIGPNAALNLCALFIGTNRSRRPP